MNGRGIDIVAGTSSVYDYLWGTGETTPAISPTAEGTYTVLISVGNCSITDHITLTEFCPSTLFVPNSFTPDGDGKNDSFNASGTYIGDFEMYIYNRWGEMIYKSESLTQDWDGKYKEKDVQVDVYVYKIYYSVNHPDGNPRKETKVGTVTVMR
jgi:gliding motility-associated-like protein